MVAPTNIYGNYTGNFFYGSCQYYGAVTTFARPLPPRNFYVIREKDYYILKWNHPEFNEDGTVCVPVSYYIYRSAHSNKRDPELVAVLSASGLIPPDTCYADSLDPDRVGDTVYYYQVLCVNDKVVGGILSDWTTDLFIVKNLLYEDTGLYTSTKNNYFYQLLQNIPESVVFDKEANVIPYRSVYKWNASTEKYDIPFSDYLIFDFFPDLPLGTILSVKVDNVTVSSNDTMRVPCNYTYNIIAVDQPNKTFVIADSHLNTFKNTRIDVDGSTGNDGTYTIQEVKLHRTVVTNELFNSYDLQLDHYPIIAASETITNETATITYVNGTDYTLDCTTGVVTWISGAIPAILYATYTYEDSTKTDIVVLEVLPSTTVDGNIRPYGEPFFYTVVQSLTYKDEIKVDICSADGSIIYKTKYFKPYNYLVFIATMAAALLLAKREVERTQQNLYKDECDFDKLYPNFGVFFNLTKPKYLTDEQYRDLLIGNGTLPGLYNAGFKGGTWGAVKDAIKSLTNYDPDIEKYLTNEGWVIRSSQEKSVLSFEPSQSGTATGGERYIIDYSTYKIFDINKASKYFYIHGDYTTAISVSDTFDVFGSTGNDRTYTVTARVASTPTVTNELVAITSNVGQLDHASIVASSYTITNTTATITYVEGVTNDYTLDLTTGKITWYGLANPPTPTQVLVTYNYNMTRITVSETIPENIADGAVHHTEGDGTGDQWNGHTNELAAYDGATWTFTIPYTTTAVVDEVVTLYRLQGTIFNKPVQMSSENITNLLGTITYVRGVDYRINYLTGVITWFGSTAPASVKVDYNYIVPVTAAKVTAKDKVYIFDGFFWREGQDNRYVIRKSDDIIDMSGGPATLWFIPDSGTITVTSVDLVTTYAVGVNYTFNTTTGLLTWITPVVPNVRVSYPITSSDAELNRLFSYLYKTFTWKLLIYNEVRMVTREAVVSSAYIDYLDGYPVLYIMSSGIIIDEYGQNYLLGVDFTVEYATGKIIWVNQPGTNTPPIGRKYYVDYVFSLGTLIDYMANLLKHPQYNIYHVSGLGFGLVSFGVFPFGSPWTV
jgi:hypothetical protein